MRFLSRKSVLFILLILNFSLLNAQGMPGGNGAPGGGMTGGSAPGGNPPSGEHPAGPHPPAGNENPGNFLPLPPPPKNPDNIMKYRGSRTYSENLPLKILSTKCAKVEAELVCIEIFFNQSINPRSLKTACVYINNTPLPPFVRFHFNRKGDSVKIFVPLTINTFKMKVCNICSFEGSLIEPVELLVEVER